MDPVCCGRTFMTNASDLATLVKCQLGVMEEPKENADKVSWTAYGRPLALKVGKVDIRKMRNQEGTIQQCSNRFDVSYFLYMPR